MRSQIYTVLGFLEDLCFSLNRPKPACVLASSNSLDLMPDSLEPGYQQENGIYRCPRTGFPDWMVELDPALTGTPGVTAGRRTKQEGASRCHARCQSLLAPPLFHPATLPAYHTPTPALFIARGEAASGK